jgi:hypothetical protein
MSIRTHTTYRSRVSDRCLSAVTLPVPGKSARLRGIKTALAAFTVGMFLVLVPSQRGRAANSSSGVVSVLQRKYVVTETTPDREQVTKNGTTMSMNLAGVYTLPTSDMVMPDTKVSNGKVQSPSMFVRLTWTKMGAHVLQSGDKVYITKIESKNESGGEVLQFTVLTVDSLDATGQDSQKKYDGNISFRFKKGYLEEAAPEDVEQAVEAVLAPDTGGDDSQGGDNSADANQGQQQGGPAAPPPPQQVAAPPPPPPPPPAPAGPPPTIKIGESSTEVLQAMGMPLQMIDLGRKKTYVYKNMKIIFLNDKVSDVQ